MANSNPTDITTGPDNNLYFTEPGVNEIGQLNPATLVVHGARDPDGQ